VSRPRVRLRSGGRSVSGDNRSSSSERLRSSAGGASVSRVRPDAYRAEQGRHGPGHAADESQRPPLDVLPSGGRSRCCGRSAAAAATMWSTAAVRDGSQGQEVRHQDIST